MNSTRLLTLSRMANRAVLPKRNLFSKAVEDLPGWKKKQQSFQMNDGKLVWQKMGFKDDSKYFFTLLLVAAGGVEWARWIYKMAYNKK
uniref:Uncharacterized protein n=1 Tax=Acartia pacifica TaxID=335913 RepID=A0A0U2IG87_ACAPC|nr:hypothetical protein [Acartia pacifica]